MIRKANQQAFTERFGVEIIRRSGNVQSFGFGDIEKLIEQTPDLLRDRITNSKAFGLFSAMFIGVKPCPYQYEEACFRFTTHHNPTPLPTPLLFASAQP